MNLIQNTKEIIDLIEKGATLKAQEKIMELRQDALALQEENIQLKERVKELEFKLNKKGNIVWEPPYYWMKDGDKKDGPYCQKCWDLEKALIRLQSPEKGAWKCMACKSSYFNNSFESGIDYMELDDPDY